MSRRDSRHVKGAIMASALTLTGVYEFLEELDGGTSLIPAAKKALARTKVRREAISTAAKKAKRKLENIDREGEPSPPACDKPPPGWKCSRAPGHKGPCAASPAKAG